MFDNFDDSDLPSDDFDNNVDIEESLIKYKRLNVDNSIFFSEDEIEALSYHFFLNNAPKDQLMIINHGLYLYPNKVEFLIEKASIFSLDNEYGQALEIISLARSIEPYNAMVYKMEGEIFTDLEQFDEAEESFILALQYSDFEDDGFVIDIYINYAQVLTQNDKLDKATKLTEKALKRFRDDDQLYNQLSMNFVSSGEYNKAVDYFKKRIDHDPYSYLSWFHLGRFYELTNNHTLAMSAYEYSGLASTKSKNAFFSMGSMQESRNEFQKAIDNYLQCYKDETDIYPNICIARCYLALENSEMARIYLRKASALEDILPEYNYLLGFSFLTEKQPLKALQFFNKIYKEDAEDFSAIKGILTCYSELDRITDMVVLFEALKKTNKEMMIINWKDIASIFYHCELDEQLDELINEIRIRDDMSNEIKGVLDVIKYDQEPSENNKAVIINHLLHDFEESLENVKLFCPELYYDDEEFKKLVQIYQPDKNNEQ